jgi:hypothetical protein
MDTDRSIRNGEYPNANKLNDILGTNFSRSTFLRYIRTLRDDYGAPVEFDFQKNGYYYAYQTNHALGKSPCYDAEPIKVVLPDDSKSSAEKLNIYGYIFTLLMAFTLI